MRGPLVLGVHPRRGWEEASDVRRFLTCLVPALLLAWPLLARGGELGEWFVVTTALSIGPPAFWSAARVLRPHEGRDWERVLRHAASSGCTAFGCATLALMFGNGQGDGALLVLVPATLGLQVTPVWGLVALVVRSLRAPRRQPRTWPSPVTT